MNRRKERKKTIEQWGKDYETWRIVVKAHGRSCEKKEGYVSGEWK